MVRDPPSGVARVGPRWLAMAVALVLVASLVAPAVLGARSSKPKEIVVVGSATLSEGPLEGQDGWSTGIRGDDGGYRVVPVDEPPMDQAVSNLPAVSPDSGETLVPPQILRSIDPTSEPHLAFHLRPMARGAPSAGVRLYDSGTLGTSPADAYFEAYVDELGRVKVRFPWAPDVRLIVFEDPVFALGPWIEVDVDAAADGSVQVCVFPMDLDLQRGRVKWLTVQLPRLADGSRPTVDTLAFAHLQLPERPPVEAQWGSAFAPEEGQTFDPRPCPGAGDDFEDRAPGSDLPGQGGWSGDRGVFLVAEETLVDGSVNRYADPSTNDKRDVDMRIVSGTSKASAAVSMRASVTDARSGGFFLADGDAWDAGEPSFFDVFMDDGGRMVAVAPDGTEHRLPGGYVADSFFDIFVDVDADEDRADACVEERLNKLPGRLKWSSIVLKRGDAALPSLDTLGLLYEGTGAKTDWDDVALFGVDMDLCPIHRDSFESYAAGSDLAGQGGWSGPAAVFHLVELANGAIAVEGPAPAGVDGDLLPDVSVAVEEGDVLSFGASMSTSDPTQAGPGIGVGILRSRDDGQTFVEPFLDVFIADGVWTVVTPTETLALNFERIKLEANSFFDVFVDMDTRSGETEVCVRGAAAVPIPVPVYDIEARSGTHTTADFPDALVLSVGDDRTSTAIGRWDNIIHGAGDGDLCPLPAVMSLVATGPLGNEGWYVGDLAVDTTCTDPFTGATRTGDRVFYVDETGVIRFEASGRGLDIRALDVQGQGTARVACEVKPGYFSAQDLPVPVDSIPPTFKAVLGGLQGNDGWWRSAVDVTLECDDATSGAKQLDAVIFSDAGVTTHTANSQSGESKPLQIKLGLVEDGEHTILSDCEDVAGNDMPTAETKARIDKLPPTLVANVPAPDGANGWYVTRPFITLDASDQTSGVRTTFYQIDGRVSTYEGPFEIEDNGVHTLEVWAEDIAGNVAPRQTFEIKVDTVAPAVGIFKPKVGCVYVLDEQVACHDVLEQALVIGDITVESIAHDDTSGVDRVEFYVDGELRHVAVSEPYDFAWDTSGEMRGEHEVTAIAFDVAGNEESVGRVASVVPLVAPALERGPPGVGRDVAAGERPL